MTRLTALMLTLLVTSGCGTPCFGPLPHGNAPVGVIIRDGLPKDIIQAGIDIWNEGVGTQLVIGLETDYMVTIRKMEHADLLPEYLGFATLYDSMELRFEPQNGYPTVHTVAHEFGHLLGLDHIPPTLESPCNIMNPVHCESEILTNLDIQAYEAVDYFCEKTTE